MSADTERLTPKAVRALNKTLAPLNLRICRTHQGHPLPLDAAHFYRVNDHKLDTECKTCQKRRSVLRRRERYQNDPSSREAVRAYQRAYVAQHRQRVNAQHNASKRRVKAAQFARILGVQP